MEVTNYPTPDTSALFVFGILMPVIQNTFHDLKTIQTCKLFLK
jgi:hypothetical protein